MENQYNVSIRLNNGEGTTISEKAQVEFLHDPEQYGNGWSMWIESHLEPFGGQGYDLRYNKDFDIDKVFSFLTTFYENRFDGTGSNGYKLICIRISEAEFDSNLKGGDSE